LVGVIGSLKFEVSVLTETVKRSGFVVSLSWKISRESGGSFETSTITSDEEIFSTKGSIKWEFSLVIGSSTSLIN
jgi:hypothetical protein